MWESLAMTVDQSKPPCLEPESKIARGSLSLPIYATTHQGLRSALVGPSPICATSQPKRSYRS